MESKYTIKPNEQQEVRVKIQRKGDLQKAEMKVFINDEDKNKETYDCILFRVEYINIF